MKHHQPSDDSVLEGQRAHLIPVALLLILALFPPETRGESMAGSAILLALFALVFWPRRLGPVQVLPMLAWIPAAFALPLMAQAPGMAVGPVVVSALAFSAGLSALCLPKDVRSRTLLPRVVALAAAAVSVYAVYQRLHGLEAVASFLEQAQVADREVLLERARGGRAFAAFATPAALGGYLVLCLPVCVVAGLGATGRTRWLFWGASVLQLGGLVASASATAAAAALGAIGLAFLRRRRLRRPLLFAAAVGLAVVAVVVVMRGPEVTGTSERGNPWSLRARNLRVAAQMTADHPWAGVGPGGFGEVYPQYRRPGDNQTRHVHDLPLELTAELGLPIGLGASAAFFAVFLFPLFRRTADSPGWWRGMEIGLAAFALHNLVDFTAFLPSTLWTAAILRGWIGRRDLRVTKVSGPVLAAVAVTLAASVLAAFGGLAWNDRRAARNALARGDADRAGALAGRSTRLAPWDPDGWLIYSRALVEQPPEKNLARALAAALEALDRAVALSPVRPAARDARARVRLALADRPGAFADASVAASLYPREKRYAELRDETAAALPSPPEAAGEVP